MAVTADSVYQFIKSYEGQFRVPAPYVTIDVGSFDAAIGTFSGLTTTIERDPEPIEHGPHDHPKNPPPQYVGDKWLSVTVDSAWRQTMTSVPAPHVPLAPVLLRFAITNAVSPWTVTAHGVSVSAPAGQSTLIVNIWDRTITDWNVQAGAQSYHDTLRVQRPVGDVGAGLGAFTIPVLPVTIVYAPPADSLGASSGKYSADVSVGTTVTYAFGTDTSHEVPNLDTGFSDLGGFKAVLDLAVHGLSLFTGESDEAKNAGKLSNIFSIISSEIGQISASHETGISDLNERQMTVRQTATDSLSTNAEIGGPGVGDVIHFFKNLRLVWSFYGGQLRLSPLDYEQAAFTVTGLQNNLDMVNISSGDAQLLLDLDPFVVGGADAALPDDRFTLQERWEYGFGATVGVTLAVTRETETTTTHKTYTTDTNSWEPGPIFKLLGLGGRDQATTTLSNATGNDVSSTVTLEASLTSGPEDYFDIAIWYDTLFGTFAFQQRPPGHQTRLHGGGAQPGQQVRLEVGGKVFRTVADANGDYMFRAQDIGDGDAMLMVGKQPRRLVKINGAERA
jgi:hypothetical protein